MYSFIFRKENGLLFVWTNIKIYIMIRNSWVSSFLFETSQHNFLQFYLHFTCVSEKTHTPGTLNNNCLMDVW